MPAGAPIFTTDRLTVAAIFLVILFIYWISPVTQVTDSNYSMLLSQDLLEHRSFLLDHYAIPRLSPEPHYNTIMNGSIHQIEVRDNHLYYYFPPGTSILSIPFVGLVRLFGLSTTNSDGSYNPEAEAEIEAALAALLMAILAAILYLTARWVLPAHWSAIIALGAALGTQMWSTASRAMWTETWGIFLIGIIIWMLVRAEVSGHKLNPIVLGTLLAWTYFVRPTNAVAILGVSLWVFFRQRQILWRCLLTGVVWLSLFVAYSWQHFNQVLPQYYLANRLAFREAWVALPGNLISPSRGLLVFVPVLLWIAFWLLRYRQYISHRSLLWLALGITSLHMIVIAGFDPWHGGFSYGPRFTTGLVPWFTLLAVLATKAMLDWRQLHKSNRTIAGRLQLVCGGVLLLMSVFMNARGALARETWVWNVRPQNVDDFPVKVWDWRYPQFLAGWMRPPRPSNIPPLSLSRVDFASPAVGPYLWFGWSEPDPQSRWTEAREAGLIFGLADDQRQRDAKLVFRLSAFVIPNKHPTQRVAMTLNGSSVENLVIETGEPHEITITLPVRLLEAENELILKLPDAASPKSLGLSKDARPLAIAIHWMQLEFAN